jgi:HD superfamily phosphohydrolase YqeK
LVADALREAGAGRLPAWAAVGPARRGHIERVAALLDEWAVELDLDAVERARWRAAGWLHDALRDADANALRAVVPEQLHDLPVQLLHGPAAARRLRADGVADAALLDAVSFHTLGHPCLDLLGRALYAADFLEPGRTFAVGERAALRARMPHAFDAVLRAVVRARMTHLLASGRPIREETVAFWNVLSMQRADDLAT